MREVACAIHAPPSQQFVGQDHSKLARFAYEDVQQQGPLFCTLFPACTPYLIIDGIQIWAVRGSQCRIYEVMSYIRQKCNCFSSSVRWSTILLENVKFREFLNFK